MASSSSVNQKHRLSSRKKLTVIVGAALTTSQVFANVVGPDMQNFNATPDGLDFVTVESSEVLRPGVLNLGLFLNYAANTLPEFPEDGAASDPHGKLQDRILGADFNAAVGLWKHLQIGLSLPHVLGQTIVNSTDTQRGQFASTGTTEIRPSAKLRFFGDQRGGVALVSSLGFNMIEGNAWTGDGAPPIWNILLAGDKEFGPVTGGLNIGYRKRTPGSAIVGAPVEPIGDQYIGSAAISTLLPKMSSKLIAEIYGAAPAKSGTNFSNRSSSSAEALLGIKHDATTNLALHAGGSMGLKKGIASPDWRLYAGLNYTMGPMFQKRQKEDSRRKVKRPAPVASHVNAPEPVAEEIPQDITQDNPFIGTPIHGEETFVISNVMFAFDEDKVVLPGTKDILQHLKTYLLRAPVFTHLTIEGHTDYVGSDAYNQNLSERRAASIRRYLVEYLQVDGSKISSIGYGESRPIADNGNFQGRQLNRRVEFKITR